MRTRTIYTLLIILIASFVPAYGQKEKPKSKMEMRKEIRAFKINYLAQEMELTQEQKEQFKVLYDRMSAERWKLFKEARIMEHRVKKNPAATEAEYQAAANAMTEAKNKDADLMKKYDAEYAKFMSAKQIFKLKEAEQEFDQRMRKMHQERKSARHGKTAK